MNADYYTLLSYFNPQKPLGARFPQNSAGAAKL